MHTHKYFLTEATDKEEAQRTVSDTLEEIADYSSHLFDYGNIVQPIEIVPIHEIRDALNQLKEDATKKIETYKNRLNNPQENISKNTTGHYHKKIGVLLLEDLDIDMPFWNLDSLDYNIPDDGYAVKVDLHH